MKEVILKFSGRQKLRLDLDQCFPCTVRWLQRIIRQAKAAENGTEAMNEMLDYLRYKIDEQEEVLEKKGALACVSITDLERMERAVKLLEEATGRVRND